MTSLNELFKADNDEDQALFDEISDLILEARSDSLEMIQQTAEQVEEWLQLAAQGNLDQLELQQLLDARYKTLQQFINTQEIRIRSQIERVTIGLIELIRTKLLGLIF